MRHVPGTEVRVPLGATLGSGEDRFINCFVNPSLLPWPVILQRRGEGGNRQSRLHALGF